MEVKMSPALSRFEVITDEGHVYIAEGVGVTFEYEDKGRILRAILTPMERPKREGAVNTMKRILRLSVFFLAFFVPTICLAQDQDNRWVRPALRETERVKCEWTGNCERYYRYERWRERRAHWQRYRQERYERDPRLPKDVDYISIRDRERQGFVCKRKPIDVLSTEHQSEEDAFDAGVKMWMAKTNWVDGGQYMELASAAAAFKRCGPSNPHDNFSGKVSEGAQRVVKFIPGTAANRARKAGEAPGNKRCYITAIPCTPPLEPADRERGR